MLWRCKATLVQPLRPQRCAPPLPAQHSEPPVERVTALSLSRPLRRCVARARAPHRRNPRHNQRTLQISQVYEVHAEDLRPLYDIADQLLDVFDKAHIRYSRMEPGCAGFPVFAALQQLAQRAVASPNLPENESVPPMQQGLDVLKVCTLALPRHHLALASRLPHQPYWALRGTSIRCCRV